MGSPFWGHVLVAMHTACLLVGLHYYAQMRLVDAVFDRLVSRVVVPSMSESERALELMHALHRIQMATKPMLVPRDVSLAADLPPPDRVPFGLGFMDARWHLGAPFGACGSFTSALVYALERAGLEVRITQMLCGGTGTCHVLLEAHVDGAWAVLDPLMDQSFRRPDGRLASYAEVSADWEGYATQVPAWRRTLPPLDENYNDVETYNFQGVQYTNWSKIPVLMPLVRRVLEALWGEERIATLSIRTYVHDINRAHGVLTAIVYAFVWLATILRFRARRAARP